MRYYDHITKKRCKGANSDMARPEVYGIGDVSPGAREEPRSDLGERRLRRISAWFMLFFLFQGQLGPTWDREWHAYGGRDWFWTPPHILIYTLSLHDALPIYRRCHLDG